MIRLQAGGSVSGRVSDDSGAPLEGVGVSIKNSRGEDVFLFNIGTTGSDGRYALSFFVNNVFDKFYLVNSEDFFAGLWGSSNNAVIGQPARDARRYAGLRFNVYFD